MHSSLKYNFEAQKRAKAIQNMNYYERKRVSYFLEYEIMS